MKWLASFCVVAAAAAASLNAPIAARAQDYPTKPIRLMLSPPPAA